LADQFEKSGNSEAIPRYAQFEYPSRAPQKEINPMKRMFLAIAACASILTVASQAATKVPVRAVVKVLLAECDGPLPLPPCCPSPNDDGSGPHDNA
jgi:hypothetical protein